MPEYPKLKTVAIRPTPELFYRTLHEPLNIQSILDVGSGHGGIFDCGYWTARPMQRRATCDIFRCRDMPDCWEIKNGVDACKLTEFYPPGSFDLVQCMEVLEHIPDSRKALEELCRVARKLVMISSADETQHLGEEQERIEKINPRQQYVGQPKVKDLKALGFEVRVEACARRQLVAWKIL